MTLCSGVVKAEREAEGEGEPASTALLDFVGVAGLMQGSTCSRPVVARALCGVEGRLVASLALFCIGCADVFVGRAFAFAVLRTVFSTVVSLPVI